MPGRQTALVNGEFYHLYNRGSDKRDIFLQPRDYKRFVQTFYYYHFQKHKLRFSKYTDSGLFPLNTDPDNKLIEIVSYCLMPNHFHFLVKQLKENGISIFMSNLANSYTKYFNTKYSRIGALFQGVFKSVIIESEEQLIHLSRYIHLNPVVSGLTRDLDGYKWSSYPEYLSGQKLVCNSNQILDLFPSIEEYKRFVEAQVDYGTTLEVLKHNTIDIED